MAQITKRRLFALALALVVSGGAQAQTRHLGLSADSVSDDRIILLDHFKRAVEQQSTGRLLIDIRRRTENFRDPTVPLAVLRAGELVGAATEFEVFDLPYLIRSREHMQRVIGSPIVMDRLTSYARSVDLELLGTLDGGFRELYSRERISNWDDLHDKVVGVWGSTRSRDYDILSGRFERTPMADFYRSLGADTPVGAVAAERAGRSLYVDVVDEPLDGATSSRSFLARYKYIFLSNHAYVPLFLVARNGLWRDLPDQEKKALETAAAESQLFSFENGRTIDQSTLETLQRHGASVEDSDLSLLSKEASREVWAEFAYGSAGSSSVLEAIVTLGPRE
jgi:TRAP-type transport system periplasmic protein